MTINIQKMLDAGVHFGHQKQYWNPKMSKFIFGYRNNIHIINLEKTLIMLKNAKKYAKTQSKKMKTILFISTKRQSRKIIAKSAKNANMPYVNNHWLGGMLTNFQTLKISIKKLNDMEKMTKSGALNKKNKKEILLFEKKLLKLKKSIGGLKKMNDLPDSIFVIDVGYHRIAVKEAKKLKIPIIAVVDTNNSPYGIKYVIPGNDDSSKAISLYSNEISNSIIEGYKKRNK